MTKQKVKLLLFKYLSVLIGIAGVCLAAEVVLRFSPVCESAYSLPVNADNPVYRCQPNRTVFLSASWDFSMRNEIRFNNEGFASDLNYDAEDERPLLAIVGDSFVEAVWVPWPETFVGRLHQSLTPSARVYAFSKSGAPMSQYLIYAKYAKETFHPAALMVVIVGNDFDQSLPQYKNNPGFHQFVKDSSGRLQLNLSDYEVGPALSLVRHSALARYLFFNVGIQALPYRVAYFLNPDRYVGNTSADSSSVRVGESKQVVDAFLSYLPKMAGLPPSKILFIVDGMRPDLYDGEKLDFAERSFFGIMRRYFVEKAGAHGFEIIDMQGIFAKHYHQHAEKFEFPRDNHWNSLGHQLVTDAVAGSELFRRLALQSRSPGPAP
jgi:hypothetical protein